MRPSSALQAALNSNLRRLHARRLRAVEVAILDSGIDATHRDLRGRVVDSCQLEMVRDTLVRHRSRLQRNRDLYGHGTGVASVIARVAPNAALVDVRVLDSRNLGSGEVLLEGLRVAVERGSRVINISAAAHARFADKFVSLCTEAYRRNLLVVASRRNRPLEDNGFPAEIPTCIGVDRASFPDDLHVSFLPSPPIEFAARGVAVPVALPGGGYSTATGTSFATPCVSGLCALLLGAWPELRPFEIKAVLKALSTTSVAGGDSTH